MIWIGLLLGIVVTIVTLLILLWRIKEVHLTWMWGKEDE